MSSPHLSTFALKKTFGDTLLVDNSSKDFKILVQGQEILAHRCVLALKSPVLAALLRSDMVESRCGEMKIVDFEANVVRIAVIFLYKGYLPTSIIAKGHLPSLPQNRVADSKTLIGLVHFGHKYDIPDLIDYTIKKVWYYQKSFDPETRKDLLSIVYKIDPEMNGVCGAVLGIFGTEGFRFDTTKYPTFSNNMEMGAELYADNTYKNLKIRFGTQKILVHKCIISIGCPALLQTMAIRPGGKFGFFKAETVEEVIGFLYKGEISTEAQKDPSILIDLLNFGDEYKCDKIVNYSFGLLKEVKNSMTVESKGDLIRQISKMKSSAKVYDLVMGIFSTDFKGSNPSKSSNPCLGQ